MPRVLGFLFLIAVLLALPTAYMNCGKVNPQQSVSQGEIEENPEILEKEFAANLAAPAVPKPVVTTPTEGIGNAYCDPIHRPTSQSAGWTITIANADDYDRDPTAEDNPTLCSEISEMAPSTWQPNKARYALIVRTLPDDQGHRYTLERYCLMGRQELRQRSAFKVYTANGLCPETVEVIIRDRQLKKAAMTRFNVQYRPSR